MTFELHEVRSPRGNPTRVCVRAGTSDLSVVHSTAFDDEYRLRGRTISGWAIDIGAHIGTVGLAILADNPDARLIFVEPLAPNCELIRTALDANGWTDRSIVVHGAIAKGKTAAIACGYDSTDYGRTNRFVGGLMEQQANEVHVTEVVRAYRFRDIVDMARGPVQFVKWDAEGAEWFGLADPAARAVPVHIGEYHGDPQQPGIEARLGATHDLTYWNVMAPNGLFEATRRA